MKTQINRDKNRRKLLLRYESRRVAYKYLISNLVDLDNKERLQYMYMLNQLPRNSSKVRIRNRCVLTGRGNGVHRQFKMSRIMLRHLASNGLISGMSKSSW